jgi:hypothetical protein
LKIIGIIILFKILFLKLKEQLTLLKRIHIVFKIGNSIANLKKVFINKRISFYYKIYPNEIVVFLFWNNYENPEKLKSQLLSL